MDSNPGEAGFPLSGAVRGYAVSRSSKESGVMSMWNSRPSTLASRDRVASDGSWSPASSRAIAGCCMPSSRASAVCDSSWSIR